MNFSTPETQFMENLPLGHDGYTFDDIENCPVFKINKKIKHADNSKNQSSNNHQEDSENEPSTEDEGEDLKGKGSCPVMTDQKSRNPSLVIPETGYNLPYVSPWNSSLGMKGIFDLKPDTRYSIVRKNWDKYPIYLKHTIFFAEEDIERIRKKDIAHRLFMLDR